MTHAGFRADMRGDPDAAVREFQQQIAELSDEDLQAAITQGGRRQGAS